MKIDKVSFGTAPATGAYSFHYLYWYKKSFADGLFDAFEKLEQNKNPDRFHVFINQVQTKKGWGEDLSVNYISGLDGGAGEKSVWVHFGPAALEKLSKKNVSKFFMATYEAAKNGTLKQSKYKPCSMFRKQKISDKYMEKLYQKYERFINVDDTGCA